MSHPTSSWWDKLARSEEHRNLLDQEIRGHFAEERNLVRLVVEHGAKAGDYLYRVVEIPPAPVARWGVIIGDIVHNLRSALDHMAWHLALIKHRGVAPRDVKNVFFPIYSCPSKFENSGAKVHFEKRHWAVFEAIQPYHGERGLITTGWVGEYFHQLGFLQELSNRDKHQSLIPTLMLPLQFQFRGLAMTGDLPDLLMTAGPLEEGTVVGRVRGMTPTEESNVHMEGHISPLVGLPGGVSRPVIPAFIFTEIFIRLVFREFEPLF